VRWVLRVLTVLSVNAATGSEIGAGEWAECVECVDVMVEGECVERVSVAGVSGLSRPVC
jgi:hypothetical protein